MEKVKVVKLLKNNVYSTYQLFAEMGNSKTSVADGLVLAAGVVIDWVKERVGEDAPSELLSLTPESSFYLSEGYVVNIVSLLEQGVWTLQITEPDLGSHPGEVREDSRAPVPGRVIETNIGFYVKENKLQCGFKIVVSDPEGSDPAEVYRLAVVRKLIYDPAFGLTQVLPLTHECTVIDSVGQYRKLMDLVRGVDNQLPVVVFTQPEAKLPSIEAIAAIDPVALKLGKVPAAVPSEKAPEYDVDSFAKYGVGYCRTYLARGLCDRLECKPGDIVVFEPKRFGGKKTVFTDVDSANDFVRTYPRGKNVDFGSVVFLEEARAEYIARAGTADTDLEDMVPKAEVLGMIGEWQKKENELLSEVEKYKGKVDDRDDTIRELKDRVAEASSDAEEELARLEKRISFLERKIDFLKRKDSLPKAHKDIAGWVEKSFAGRLVLHDKAKKLLEDKSAASTDVTLICNALEYLATEYYDNRYGDLSNDDRLMACSEKYERSFEVKHQAEHAIEAYPAAYKIKYGVSRVTGKPCESALDYHLCCGNTAPFLIRIYFLHDDDKKLIVVGSLPNHLPTFGNPT